MNEKQESMNEQEVFPYVEASRRLYERLDRLYKELDIPTDRIVTGKQIGRAHV